MQKIGFGGSCHWCTEAIFSSLKGVVEVKQGWISSDGDNDNFSEAVVVKYLEEQINLHTLIEIHLHTHSCTSVHTMRSKYRSAIYVFDAAQLSSAKTSIRELQTDFDQPIITDVISFRKFKQNQDRYLNYYYSNREKPFCQNIINPKLQKIITLFSSVVNLEKTGKLDY